MLGGAHPENHYLLFFNLNLLTQEQVPLVQQLVCAHVAKAGEIITADSHRLLSELKGNILFSF